MRHIAIVNAVYPPEPVVSAQMGRDLAEHLVDRGARVTVLCPAPSRPLGADYEAFQPTRSPLVRQENGVTVVRLPSYTAPKSRLFSRLWESWSFGRQACRYLDTHVGDADAVYVNTWPLASQALLASHCRKRRVPLVWHIKDVYPEALFTRWPRVLRTLAGRPLIALDRWIVLQAQHTVVLSDGFRRIYLKTRGLRSDMITTVLDWVDERRFESRPDRSRASAKYRVRADRFTFLYFGNIGPVAGVDLLIRAFHIAEVPNAQLIIAGDGSAKAKSVALATSLGAEDIQFISDPDATNVPLLHGLGDVCLLPLRRGAGLSSIPSKLMAYLLSAKPVLATLDREGDTARFITEAQCGWIGEPEDLPWLATKMRQLPNVDRGDLAAMGERGRAYGLINFSRATGVRRVADIILGVCLEVR